MRKVRDRDLTEVFATWIDQRVGLPENVVLLPIRIDVSGVALGLVTISISCLPMAAIVGSLSKSFIAEGTLGAILMLTLFMSILLGLPIWMTYRLWRSLGARRDQKAGTLRQGIFVGPQGVLIRLSPNRCYPIAMEKFVTAKEWSGGGESGTDWFTVETRDGKVEFAADMVLADAAELNRAVATVLSRNRGKS